MFVDKTCIYQFDFKAWGTSIKWIFNQLFDNIQDRCYNLRAAQQTHSLRWKRLHSVLPKKKRFKTETTTSTNLSSSQIIDKNYRVAYILMINRDTLNRYISNGQTSSDLLFVK